MGDMIGEAGGENYGSSITNSPLTKASTTFRAVCPAGEALGGGGAGWGGVAWAGDQASLPPAGPWALPPVPPAPGWLQGDAGDGPLLLVTGGGGADSSFFIDKFMDAARILARRVRFRAIVGAGPFLHSDQYRLLRSKARGLPVRVTRELRAAVLTTLAAPR